MASREKGHTEELWRQMDELALEYADSAQLNYLFASVRLMRQLCGNVETAIPALNGFKVYPFGAQRTALPIYTTVEKKPYHDK
jgi:hypothetical protein